MPETKVLQRTGEVLKVAESLFRIDLSGVVTQFSLLGSAAGQAGAVGTLDEGALYYIRFNRDMLHRKAFGHVYKEAIPHEVAHIVCYIRPELGRKHNWGWSRVCKALGGTAAVLHDEEIVYGKGLTYEYYTTAGFAVRVSEQVHRRVEAGQCYSFRPGQGIIDLSCPHSIVGQRGKTLEVPIVKRAVELPLLLAA